MQALWSPLELWHVWWSRGLIRSMPAKLFLITLSGIAVSFSHHSSSYPSPIRGVCERASGRRMAGVKRGSSTRRGLRFHTRRQEALEPPRYDSNA